LKPGGTASRCGEPLISGRPLHKGAHPSNNELRTRRGSHGVPAEHGLLKHQRTLSPTPRFCGRFGGARRSSNPEPHWSDLGTFTRFSATGPIETVVHASAPTHPEPPADLDPRTGTALGSAAPVRRRPDGGLRRNISATRRRDRLALARFSGTTAYRRPSASARTQRGHQREAAMGVLIRFVSPRCVGGDTLYRLHLRSDTTVGFAARRSNGTIVALTARGHHLEHAGVAITFPTLIDAATHAWMSFMADSPAPLLGPPGRDGLRDWAACGNLTHACMQSQACRRARRSE
jgi:hypothetical protein